MPLCIRVVVVVVVVVVALRAVLRRLIEEATGSVTFSQYADGALATHPEEPKHDVLWEPPGPHYRGVAAAYARVGGYAGNRSWPDGARLRMLVKTHWPKRYGGLGSLDADATPALRTCPALILHRFPLDAIASFLRYQYPSLSPTRAIDASPRRGVPTVAFEAHSLRTMAANWTRWHAYWLDRRSTVTVSYERLLVDAEATIGAVLKELDASGVGCSENGNGKGQQEEATARPTAGGKPPDGDAEGAYVEAAARAVALYPPRRGALLSSLRFFTAAEVRDMAAEIVNAQAVRDLGYRQQLVGLLGGEDTGAEL